MLCNKCGNQIPDNSATCPNCGAPVNGGTQVPFGTPAAKVPFMQQTDTGINFIALIIAVVGFVCVFLSKTVLKVSVFGVTQKQTFSILGEVKYGIFMLVLFAVTAICLFLKKSNSAVAPAAVNAVFCIFKAIQELADGKKQLASIGADSSMASYNLNIFFWLVVILSIVEVVAILVLPKVMGNKQ